jgi:hypothetical protein
MHGDAATPDASGEDGGRLFCVQAFPLCPH